MKNINIDVDELWHRMWKQQAAREGITLKDFVIKAASRAVSPDIIGAVSSEKYAGKKGGEK